jgi:hypothetical protein
LLIFDWRLAEEIKVTFLPFFAERMGIEQSNSLIVVWSDDSAAGSQELQRQLFRETKRNECEGMENGE